MPNTILLSLPRNGPEAVIATLSDSWSRLGIEPRAVASLASDEEGDLSFSEIVGACTSWEQLCEWAAARPVEAVQFHCGPPQDDLYLYQWTRNDQRYVSAELGRGRLAHFESEEYPTGVYQVAIMLALASSAGADLLAFSKAVDEDLFVGLDSESMLKSLRAGKLFEKWTPAVHLFSTSVVTETEMEKNLEVATEAAHLRHTISPGYHVVSQFAGAA